LEDDDNVSANSSSNDDDDSGFSRISSIRWSYCWAWATLPEILNPKLESNLWVAGFLQSGEAAAELEQFFLRSWTLNPNPIHRWQDFFNQVKQLLWAWDILPDVLYPNTICEWQYSLIYPCWENPNSSSIQLKKRVHRSLL
jgi:hypothetical protein